MIEHATREAREFEEALARATRLLGLAPDEIERFRQEVLETARTRARVPADVVATRTTGEIRRRLEEDR